MKGLAAILRLEANPKILLPDLFDVICERFSPREDGYTVSVSCPQHPDCHVSVLGFNKTNKTFMLL